MEHKELYKKGDVVKVYSLQSFFGGGFINGTEGVVSQDQLFHGSVLVSIKRKSKGEEGIDPSYEVYPQQLEFVCHAGEKEIRDWGKMIEKIKKKNMEKKLFDIDADTDTDTDVDVDTDSYDNDIPF